MKINKIELEIEGKTVRIERLANATLSSRYRGQGATIFVNEAEFTSLSPLADNQGCFDKAKLVYELCYGSSVRRGKTVPNYTNSMVHDFMDLLSQFIQ